MIYTNTILNSLRWLLLNISAQFSNLVLVCTDSLKLIELNEIVLFLVLGEICIRKYTLALKIIVCFQSCLYNSNHVWHEFSQNFLENACTIHYRKSACKCSWIVMFYLLCPQCVSICILDVAHLVALIRCHRALKANEFSYIGSYYKIFIKICCCHLSDWRWKPQSKQLLLGMCSVFI